MAEPVSGTLSTFVKKDFVEIGTSDFDTEIQLYPPGSAEQGVSVDALHEYIELLPNHPNCIKIAKAVGDTNGTANISFVPLETIKREGLDRDVRGHGMLDVKPGTVNLALVLRGYNAPDQITEKREVETITFSKLAEEAQFNVIGYLKIDVEGYEARVFRGLRRWLDEEPMARPPFHIRYESNSHTTCRETSDIMMSLFDRNYDFPTDYHHAGMTAADNDLMLNIFEVYPKLCDPEVRPEYFVGFGIMHHPDGYDYTNPPHENTYEAAMAYSRAYSHDSVGITFEEGRYTVRKGPYLIRTVLVPRNRAISWLNRDITQKPIYRDLLKKDPSP